MARKNIGQAPETLESVGSQEANVNTDRPVNFSITELNSASMAEYDMSTKTLLETTLNAHYAVKRVINDKVALALVRELFDQGVI